MTEVDEFLSASELIADPLREFALQYDRLSDVWAYCDRPDWMLELLKRSCNRTYNYGCSSGLGKYVDYLKGVTTRHCDEPNETVEYYFNYKRGISSIQREVESGAISAFEGDRRCFIWLWLAAFEATRYVFENEVDRFDFDLFAEKIIAEHMGIELLRRNRDDIEFKRSLLKRQADHLRAAIGDPI